MGIKEGGRDWWWLKRTGSDLRTGGGCRGQEKDKEDIKRLRMTARRRRRPVCFLYLGPVESQYCMT